MTKLFPRQEELLRLLAEGHDEYNIRRIQGWTESTYKNELSRVMSFLFYEMPDINAKVLIAQEYMRRTALPMAAIEQHVKKDPFEDFLRLKDAELTSLETFNKTMSLRLQAKAAVK